MQKVILVAGGLILMGVVVFFILSGRSNVVPDLNGIILFYGTGCPHCKNVDDYIKQNNIEEKIRFQKLEVFYNNKNADLLGQLAQNCGLDSETLGVPFLWNGASSTCASGEIEIIDFFKAKIGG